MMQPSICGYRSNTALRRSLRWKKEKQGSQNLTQYSIVQISRLRHPRNKRQSSERTLFRRTTGGLDLVLNVMLLKSELKILNSRKLNQHRLSLTACSAWERALHMKIGESGSTRRMTEAEKSCKITSLLKRNQLSYR